MPSPVVHRAARMFEFRAGSGLSRLLIWQGTIDLAVSPVEPPGAAIQLGQFRRVIGFGPETMRYAFNQSASPQFHTVGGYQVAVDRAHNLILDTLVSTGLTGVLALVWLVIGAFRLIRGDGEPIVVAGLVAAIVAHIIETQASHPRVRAEALPHRHFFCGLRDSGAGFTSAACSSSMVARRLARWMVASTPSNKAARYQPIGGGRVGGRCSVSQLIDHRGG